MSRIVYIISLLMLVSCSKDDFGTSKYSSLPARFTCNYVSSMGGTLLPAVSNLGQWCTVRLDNTGMRYQFDLMDGKGPSQYWNITANVNDRSHVWVSGLIIGTLLDMDSNQRVTCYDLVCPSCYKVPLNTQLSISGGYATCPRCKNRYELNNEGMHNRGDAPDTKLFRYRVSYMQQSNTLVVSN